VILDLYYIPVYLQTSMYTDDSFKFNESVRQLMAILEADQDEGGLPVYDEKYDKHFQAFANQNVVKTESGSGKSSNYEIYSFSTEEEFDDFVKGMRRWTYFATLKLAFSLFCSKHWAKVTLQQSVRNTYISKDKFSVDEQEELAEMLSTLKTTTANQSQQAM